MVSKPVLSLILPLYNEAEHLENSLPQVTCELEKLKVAWEIILVEDKSSDNTLEIAQKLIHGKKNIYLLRHKNNFGRGQSVRDGFIKARGEIAGYIDVDLEVAPVFIGSMIEPIIKKEVDVTTGFRIYNVSLKTLIRFILSKGYIVLMQQVLKLPYQDTEAGYKFFNRSKVLPIIKKCKNKGWFFDTEIITRSYLAGLKITEVPVLFLRNPKKTSTVSPFSDSIKYLFDLYRFKRVIANEVKQSTPGGSPRQVRLGSR